ncbi:MAG: ABC transporter substrate-binding protein [Alphaproteobacteria bacterium]|nr:substrate-binding domain-containing protein [Rhizobiaceae bacterium]MBU3963172.1 ABC transporter substrate-binding protein [Alphaproteobacteria bacterium]MBU4048774.1 ABC transporter substrate-binding protein [Alphaproteobacteria bacterium]MBU4088186.1 ABC transporter substrate-binding protein [Alphaproteobacteria bacterium]MBU4158873.1 ABC transporter substrate-binding protein [Alphaproteobacteria bacterium]
MLNRRALMAALCAGSLIASSGMALAQDKLYIPLISKGFQHQFWQAVKAGADKAATEFGVEVTFEGPDTEAQVDKQMDMLAAALAKKPAAIGFAALDSQAATPLLKQAKDAGIPIIAFDSGVDSDIPATTVTTNNLAAAALAADKMAELIGGSGKVALVVHDQTSRTGIDRRDGFVNRVKEAYPNIEIVDIQYGAGDQLQSTEITKAILTAHSDIKGIFGANEGSAIGVLNAVKETGKTGVIVIGYDSGKLQKDAIRAGEMAGAITQNPVGIGYETVKAAIAAVKGEKLAGTVDSGFAWYDKTNIDAPEIAAVLYD